MKTHNIGKLGLVGAVIGGSVLLQHTDELGDNVSKAGQFAQDMVCVAQDISGGMVQMPLCETVPAAPADPTSAEGG